MDDRHGANVHEPAGYELSGSGRPPATLHDFDAQKTVPDLTVRGPCGNPALIGEVSPRYDVAVSRVVPVPGAGAGIFVALAATCRHGACVISETLRQVAAYETQVVPAARGEVIRPPATSEETNQASRCGPRS